MKYYLPGLLLVFPASIHPRENWGWLTHEYINFHAVQYLPSGMSFFFDERTFLRDHSVDPDRDGSPGNYHYIDIDFYEEFFDGSLPHEWDAIRALYSDSVVQSIGIVPWVIDWWTDSLSVLMSNHQWESAWQIAANLGHYIADSHQPLHLTLNFNGQLSGNDGIHSRFETQLVGPKLGILPLPNGEALYWESAIDSVFQYIEDLYPDVSLILDADDFASSQDPSFGPDYYNLMWADLDSIATSDIQRAILDLASVWYTAWVNAGEPSPTLSTDIMGFDETPAQFALHRSYPNPFNLSTTLRFDLPQRSEATLVIYDILGLEVMTLVHDILEPGSHQVQWEGGKFPSGIYIARLVTPEYTHSIKMVLLK